jgi:hypothetical protein
MFYKKLSSAFRSSSPQPQVQEQAPVDYYSIPYQKPDPSYPPTHQGSYRGALDSLSLHRLQGGQIKPVTYSTTVDTLAASSHRMGYHQPFHSPQQQHAFPRAQLQQGQQVHYQPHPIYPPQGEVYSSPRYENQAYTATAYQQPAQEPLPQQMQQFIQQQPANQQVVSFDQAFPVQKSNARRRSFRVPHAVSLGVASGLFCLGLLSFLL